MLLLKIDFPKIMNEIYLEWQITGGFFSASVDYVDRIKRLDKNLIRIELAHIFQ